MITTRSQTYRALIFLLFSITLPSSTWAAKGPRITKKTPPIAREIYSSLESDNLNHATQPYDPVPVGQVEPLAQRLKLVETLIQRHGRAYDYRIHTIKELQEILSQLDKKSEIENAPPEF
ncbi:hypothetical protein WDW37_05020 [Bdellovibrionota bacterium FG-1]